MTYYLDYMKLGVYTIKERGENKLKQSKLDQFTGREVLTSCSLIGCSLRQAQEC